MFTRAIRLALVLAMSTVVFAQGEQPPPEVKALLESAQKKMQARDVKGAVEDIGKALELVPNNKGLWITSGRLKLTLKDFKGAEADFGKATEIDGNLPQAFYFKSIAQQQLKAYDKALKSLGKALEIKDDYGDAYLARARVRETTGDLEGAAKDFGRVAEIHAEYGPAYLGRAQVYSSLGAYKKAMEDYDNAMFLLQGKDQVEVMIARARTKFLMDDAAGAEADFKKALEMAPDSHQVHFSRGLLLHDMGKYDAAIADLRKALELDEKNSHEYGRFYIALSQLRQGKKDAAQKEMGEYLDKREKKDDWYVKVGGFLAGRVTEKDLLDASQHENPYTTREQSLEAHWYVAAKALAEGDKAKAQQYMALCVAIKIHNFIEYQSCVAELKRLKKAAAPK